MKQHDPSEDTSAKGIFISLEGIDGAGKSTHIAALAQAFSRSGYTALPTREPGGTPLAESLRALTLHQTMAPLTEALLMFAGRNEHIQRVIVPALAKGQAVLCDRFSDASFAYQGAGRGFSWSALETLEQWVQQQAHGDLLQPQLTLWFDLDPAIAAERLRATRYLDRFETQNIDFFTRVRKGYAQRMQEQAQRFVRIDANQETKVIRQAVLQATVTHGLLPVSALSPKKHKHNQA